MQKFKLTIKDLKSQLEKYNENANVVIVFPKSKNKSVYTDNIEIYNNQTLENDKLVINDMLVFIDICN